MFIVHRFFWIDVNIDFNVYVFLTSVIPAIRYKKKQENYKYTCKDSMGIAMMLILFDYVRTMVLKLVQNLHNFNKI